MKTNERLAVVLASFVLALVMAPPLFAGLTFEERVEAQAAIERVYHAHQIGAPRPFERAVPRDALEQKVRNYLAKNAALEERWNAPITTKLSFSGRAVAHGARQSHARPAPGAVRSAGPRSVSDSGVPRQALPRRSSAPRLRGNSRKASRNDQARASNPIDGFQPVFLASRDLPLPATGTAATAADPPCAIDDVWDNGALTGSPLQQVTAAAVWTGTEMVVGGRGEEIVSGGRYDPTMDTWKLMALDGAPEATGAINVWTGTELIVWGGDEETHGGRYNPAMNTWAAISELSAPSARGGRPRSGPAA